jgi:xylulokinase
MSEHALGFDVGLSGVRATVVRDDGALVASARRAHERARLGDGIAEHDPADWLEGVERAGREAVRGAGDVPIAAIGVSALGPAPVLVDDDLLPLTTAPLFALDRRADPQRRRIADAAAEDHAAATLDNALPKLAWWIERDPSLADRATWALDATGFVVGSLSGVPVMDSITAGDYRLPCVDAPVPSPAPVDPLTSAGGLRPGWAERLGVRAGLPVIAGTYDSFVDIAAAGVRAPGDSGLVLGSTMIVCRAAGAGLDPPPGLGVSAYPGEGTLIGGWTLAGGLVLDWFEARFAGGEDLTAATAQAEQPRLLALPYLAGERTPLWDPLARGALVGLTPDVGPADLYRALVESLALVVLDHAERLEQALGPAVSWRVTGGGVRNELWLQATADALGVPLEIPPDAAEGVGPSLLALRALGVDIERRPARTVMPDPPTSERLRGRLTLFRELSRLVAPTVHELLADPGLEGTLR